MNTICLHGEIVIDGSPAMQVVSGIIHMTISNPMPAAMAYTGFSHPFAASSRWLSCTVFRRAEASLKPKLVQLYITLWHSVEFTV